MEIIRQSSEEEMILSFLQGELKSERFCKELLNIINEMGANISIIESGDIKLPEENMLRENILSRFRGYPDKEIFNNYPKIDKWLYVKFEEDDLDKILYMDYSYWNELSNNTSMPGEAAKNIMNGTEVFGVSNQPYINGKKRLEEGIIFPPIIALTCSYDRYFLLEGHSRATVYALSPKYFNGSYGYIGVCSEEDLKLKEPKKFKVLG